MQDILGDLIAHLRVNTEELEESAKNSANEAHEVIFSEAGYTTFPFAAANFHHIQPYSPNTSLNLTFLFVDGGNAEILESSCFSLQQLRTAAVMVKNNKRVAFYRSNWLCMISPLTQKDHVYFKVKLYASEKSLFSVPQQFLIDAMDESLRLGQQRVALNKIGELIRRILELRMAQFMVQQSDPGAILVLDGSLQITHREEQKVFETLSHEATSKQILLCGLCKTNSIITKKGTSIVPLLQQHAPAEGIWYYTPLAVRQDYSDKTLLSFVKLHSTARYIFLFESIHDEHCDLAKVVAGLAQNARDAIFPGYPYGLISADQFARISHQEKELLKTQLMVHAGSHWKLIEHSLRTKNAHAVLDTIL
ncbi:DNA double-strand break repair nuclease NurA [Candidatus Woesearchaeota archaeon]|nr:DNA double-strand break repair nuclease NurA [Candidatus Woesearchaeota archaeon]